MRGGGTFGNSSAGYGRSTNDIVGDPDDDTRPSQSRPSGLKEGFAYVLYDNIRLTSKKRSLESYKLPICIIFIEYRPIVKDNMYIFFNRNATVDEITLIVKYFLGIGENESFSINPPISTSADSQLTHSNNEDQDNLWEYLGNTFVKLTSCGMSSIYCLETGVFLKDKGLFDVDTTKHTMTRNNTDPVKISTVSRDKQNSFVNEFLIKVPQMTSTVLPNLYKTYIAKLRELKQLEWEEKYVQEFTNTRRIGFTFSNIVYKYTSPRMIIAQIQNALSGEKFLPDFLLPSESPTEASSER
jgi:hypothetical protein